MGLPSTWLGGGGRWPDEVDTALVGYVRAGMHTGADTLRCGPGVLYQIRTLEYADGAPMAWPCTGTAAVRQDNDLSVIFSYPACGTQPTAENRSVAPGPKGNIWDFHPLFFFLAMKCIGAKSEKSALPRCLHWL